MTRWPTVLVSHVCGTLSAAVATAIPTMPATSALSSPVSRKGIASSITSRSRKGATIPNPALTKISARTVARRAR